MLGNKDAIANIAVRDLEASTHFYEGTLGLKIVDRQDGEVVVFKSGSASVNVYRSRFAGTNQATALTWQVDDVPAVVKALKGKGVAFEHYDMPGLTLDGDVHIGHGMKVAWFKDPDGNVLNVFSR